MSAIQFYYRAGEGAKPTVRYAQDTPFSNRFTDSARRKIVEHWETFTEDSPKESRPLGALWDTQHGIFTYLPTEFKEYLALQREHTGGQSELSDLCRTFRVSSVGAAVETADGKIVVQRRGKDLPLAPGLLDSSAAGLCVVRYGKLHFEDAIRDKLREELGITADDIAQLTLRAVHSASDYLSGMFAYRVTTRLNSSEIEQRYDRERVAMLESLSTENLGDFILERYSGNDLIGDGCATFLAALPASDFIGAITELRRRGKDIKFGQLKDGEFEPCADQGSSA